MKLSKILIGILSIAVFGCLAFGATKLAETVNNFIPSSRDPVVSGIHLAGLTRDELLSLPNNPADIQIDLVEKGNITETINGNDIVINPVDDETFKDTIKRTALKLNNDITPINSLGTKELSPGTIQYNKAGLDSTINSLSGFSQNIVPTTGANVSYNTKTESFEPVAEKVGTEINKPLFVNKVIDTLQTTDSDQVSVNLETDKLYKQPKITLGSEQLTNIIDQLNKTNSAITYKIGWNSYPLYPDTYGQWIRLSDNGEVYIDQEVLKNYFTDLGDYYNIYSSKDEALKEKTEMSGYLVNYATEAVETRKAILNNQNLTRTLDKFKITIDDIAPIYTQENQTRLDQVKQQLGSEFVYINLDQQFMWYYKDNQLVVATPITSGTKNNHDTPKGLYDVQYKATNVTLKGNNDDGSKYESAVVYWMPFDGDIGIHDADNWRSSYGSDVYEYSGSHGCVNTPREKAAIIYNNISVGCPVLVE